MTKNFPDVKSIPDRITLLTKTSKNGRRIKLNDSVTVKYTGTLLDGTVVMSSPKQSFYYTENFKLRILVDLLPLLQEGDNAKFLIPSSSAYGSRGAGKSIKPYTPLIFDIEVLYVKHSWEVLNH